METAEGDTSLLSRVKIIQKLFWSTGGIEVVAVFDKVKTLLEISSALVLVIWLSTAEITCNFADVITIK